MQNFLKNKFQDGKIKSELLKPKIPLRKKTLVRQMSSSTKPKAPILNFSNKISNSQQLSLINGI